MDRGLGHGLRIISECLTNNLTGPKLRVPLCKTSLGTVVQTGKANVSGTGIVLPFSSLIPQLRTLLGIEGDLGSRSRLVSFPSEWRPGTLLHSLYNLETKETRDQ